MLNFFLLFTANRAILLVQSIMIFQLRIFYFILLYFILFQLCKYTIADCMLLLLLLLLLPGVCLSVCLRACLRKKTSKLLIRNYNVVYHEHVL